MIHSKFPLGPHMRAVPVRKTTVRKGVSRILIGFLASVFAPVAIVATYLVAFAAPQFATTFQLSVQRQNSGAAPIFSQLSELTGQLNEDIDILVSYLQSEAFSSELESILPVSDVFYAPLDFIYGHRSDQSFHNYLPRMIRTHQDRRSGIVSIEVRAFSPENTGLVSDALVELAQSMFRQGADLLQSTRIASTKTEFDKANAALNTARKALAGFRAKTQTLDANSEVLATYQIRASLQEQLIEAQIARALLGSAAPAGDARVILADRQLAAIQGLIEEAHQNTGAAMTDQGGSAAVLGEFERLTLELEYASQRYLSARGAYDAAQADSIGNTPVLMVFAPPVQPDRPRYPDAGKLLFSTFIVSFLCWTIGALTVAGLRDRL